MKQMYSEQVNAPELLSEVEDASNMEGGQDSMSNPMLNITQGSTGEVTCEGDAGGAVC